MGKNKGLELLITETTSRMEECGYDDEEYLPLLARLERLTELRNKSRNKVDLNTALTVAGNLFGIIAILTYEQSSVIGTKALGFVMKPKV